MTRLPSGPASPADVQPIVIASDNSFAHAYDSVADLLGEKDLGGKGGLEFFDRAGHRLTPVFNDAWELESLVPTLDDAEPDLVQARLQAVVQHVRDYLRRHPELVNGSGLSLEAAIAALPKIGEGTLRDDAAQFPGPTAPASDGAIRLMHSDGWFHNAMHAAGWAH
ncbi:hypothetical protein [Plantactinospora sp. B5E13]|uniref:hypothetical protein n=1 Tax=unclassified Plantactinospora TaxID=2631981 RepID=UPI00325D4A4A